MPAWIFFFLFHLRREGPFIETLERWKKHLHKSDKPLMALVALHLKPVSAAELMLIHLPAATEDLLGQT